MCTGLTAWNVGFCFEPFFNFYTYYLLYLWNNKCQIQQLLIYINLVFSKSQPSIRAWATSLIWTKTRILAEVKTSTPFRPLLILQARYSQKSICKVRLNLSFPVSILGWELSEFTCNMYLIVILTVFKKFSITKINSLCFLTVQSTYLVCKLIFCKTT